MKVLAVSGSLRADSHNTRLLEEAAAAAPPGVEVELFDPSLVAALPLYDQDLDTEDVPASVQLLREAWTNADALLFATPEYNGSIPGGLKNAIDWASRPKLAAALTNKLVAVIGASTGQFGAMWAQQDLKKVLGIAGACVVGDGLPVARAHDGFAEQLPEQLRALLELLRNEQGPRLGTAPEPVTSWV